MPQVAPFLMSKRKKIESGSYEVEFPLAWMQKDLHLAAVSGYETGAALPLTNSAKELYRLAMRHGHAHDDFSAIYAYLASTSTSAAQPQPAPLQQKAA
jgi:3-hydroxyisobutyrate dehydrogenase-like beta-hydroxyacid dehydrogenase